MGRVARGERDGAERGTLVGRVTWGQGAEDATQVYFFETCLHGCVGERLARAQQMT